MNAFWKTLVVVALLLGLLQGIGGWSWYKSSKSAAAFGTAPLTPPDPAATTAATGTLKSPPPLCTAPTTRQDPAPTTAPTATLKSPPPVCTAPITRGDLAVTIAVTGTIEPEEVVDVGARVEGLILSFGEDPSRPGKTVDYCSPVKEGTVLARIDDSLYTADVQTAQAQLDRDKAGVDLAQANLRLAQAKLYDAQRDWERAQKIGPSEALSQTQYDAYQCTYETAEATVGVNAAALAQAKTLVTISQAALLKAQKNVGYCTITSPVNGVIIDRRVSVGQTLACSPNAPSLFVIAKDLARLQSRIAVQEADIGNIHPGQAVTFTVDAYPGQRFQGQVGKIRLNAAMTQNAVTYTVEVNIDNSNGKLLPYQTARAQFELSRENDVLLVPNAALRWLPQADQVAPEERDNFMRMSRRPPGERIHSAPGYDGQKSAGSTDTSSASSGVSHRRGMVWMVDHDNYVKPIRLRTGATDGTNTVVLDDALKEDQQVVIAEVEAGDDPGQTTNPIALRR